MYLPHVSSQKNSATTELNKYVIALCSAQKLPRGTPLISKGTIL